MRASDMAAIDGVFLAVKCMTCGAVHPADGEDFVAFYGLVTAGLERALVGVAPPRKPAKRSMLAVCRAPECIGPLVRAMLVGGDRGDADALWRQALRVWAGEAELPLAEEAPEETLGQRKARLRPRKSA